MPVYAPMARFSDRGVHPKTLILIVGAHAALLGAVMSAKMDLPQKLVRTITEVDMIPLPVDPPPIPEPRQKPQPSQSRIDRMPVIVPIPADDPVQSDPTPLPMPIPDLGPIVRPGVDSIPQPQPQPRAEPIRVGPRFATPASKVRPPYPQSKVERGEEAALRLRLSIDENGRVVAVEPVGQVDRAFLDAARRHLIANWRYTPATEDGRRVPSSTVITLRFELQ